ncbi:hypothetical protein, partial [Undibacterium sp. CCC1.1]|uniref:hypothetical protein n=1 Tax=Undibacterium sp. CCC1.1 TaxID=3048602 RepID=UPI002B224A67
EINQIKTQTKKLKSTNKRKINNNAPFRKILHTIYQIDKNLHPPTNQIKKSRQITEKKQHKQQKLNL